MIIIVSINADIPMIPKMIWIRVGSGSYLLLRLATVLLLFALQITWAFPTGAGSCIGGEAAVGGGHLTRTNVVNTTFAALGIQVSIGGTIVTPGATFGLLIGDDPMVEIIATANPFRGALIRLEAKQGQTITGGLIPGINAQSASVCEAPVLGITHGDNDIKTSFSGVLKINNPGLTTLDITVVEVNRGEFSIYGYGFYDLVFLLPPSLPPTTAPVAPTLSPAPATDLPSTNTSFPATEKPITSAPVGRETNEPIIPTLSPIASTKPVFPSPAPSRVRTIEPTVDKDACSGKSGMGKGSKGKDGKSGMSCKKLKKKKKDKKSSKSKMKKINKGKGGKGQRDRAYLRL